MIKKEAIFAKLKKRSVIGYYRTKGCFGIIQYFPREFQRGNGRKEYKNRGLPPNAGKNFLDPP